MKDQPLTFKSKVKSSGYTSEPRYVPAVVSRGLWICYLVLTTEKTCSVLVQSQDPTVNWPGREEGEEEEEEK